jgi:hypothetical protein
VDPGFDQELQPLDDIVDALEAQGHDARFRIAAGPTLHCSRCADPYPPTQIDVTGLHRYEGETNPSDEEVVLVLRCPKGHRGWTLVAYGTSAPPEVAEALRTMPDVRLR